MTNIFNLVKYSVIIGIFLATLSFIYLFYTDNTTLTVIILLLGSIGFAPIGLSIGWLFSDIHNRCKIMRALFRKNYGVVNLVTRDGKNIASTIKNFDDDIIEIKDDIWIIEGTRIYNKTGEISNPITPENIKFVSGIPVIFVDFSNMLPLTFYEDKTKINPREMFAPIKSWVITKEAELLKWKRTTQLTIVILISIMAIVIFYAYDTHTTIREKVIPEIAEIKEKLNTSLIPGGIGGGVVAQINQDIGNVGTGVAIGS